MSCTSFGSFAQRAELIVRPCQVIAPKPISV